MSASRDRQQPQEYPTPPSSAVCTGQHVEMGGVRRRSRSIGALVSQSALTLAVVGAAVSGGQSVAFTYSFDHTVGVPGMNRRNFCVREF